MVPDRKIEFWTKFKVINTFPGDWESIFKGEGEDFFDLRDYREGDDFRKIHWSSLAKTGRLYVQEKVALRELRVNILLDLGSRMGFNTKPKTTDTFIATVGSISLRTHTSLGLAGFTNDVQGFFPSRTGRANFDGMANWVLNHKFRPSQDSSLKRVINFSFGKLPAKNLVFLVSDFLHDDIPFDRFSLFAKKYDLIAVIARDPLEISLPFSGEAKFEDSVFGCRETVVVDSQKYEKLAREDLERLESKLDELGIDHMLLSDASPATCFKSLKNLFERRKLRWSR